MNFPYFRVLRRVLVAGYCTKPWTGKIKRLPRIDFEDRLPAPTRIDARTIEQLEKVSLVDFGNEKGIKIVEDAIRFADRLQLVDTEGVEPLYTVLEDRNIPLREDEITEGDCQDDVISNAAVTEEGYFVAPPGNIPLETRHYSEPNGEEVMKTRGENQN
ncbi:hypothetical protein AAG570_005717 [Ranatra chinensis]|uniref:Glutamyl-tRNA(Gln) amidotransferase subunit C, mitochondrial n=1 Tax=Ranatra chinensis TaxID=642074 RepID=A0ABD0XY92_9HEMI